MEIEDVYHFAKQFSSESHGRTDYHKEEHFIKGQDDDEFVPLKYLGKVLKKQVDLRTLQHLGFVVESFELVMISGFQQWYETQFSRKLTQKHLKDVTICHMPNNMKILKTLEAVNESYEILRHEKILINAKKLPVQIGEWYCKCIFGLIQKKSTSQRGFDFYHKEKRVEVKIHWGDISSPKGVKLRKSLVELSDFCIVMYVAKNLTIREVCFLDSEFVLRKFSGKGHTLFLKDSDLGPYFFTRSGKHYDKVVNKNALLKFASPTMAMKIASELQA